jgi:tetratricopeptide (TPR) repeat protein
MRIVAHPPCGNLRQGALLALLLVAGATVAVLWLARRGTAPAAPAVTVERHLPDDPRLTYTGPFRNIHPDVKYTGDDACTDCHLDKARSYRQHPMGRSLVPIVRLSPAPPQDQAHNNPFVAFGERFAVERDGERVRQRRSSTALDASGQPVCDLTFDVAYAIGSGHRGYSFLMEQGGYLYQTPISWYGQKQAWDVSPGFQGGALSLRPIKGTCLYCHANRVFPEAGYVNRYRAPIFEGHAIGCERCHGPGEVHVQARTEGRPVEGPFDTTTVNPRHLEPALRDTVCEQCHLEGQVRFVRRGRSLDDYRPGLPLEPFWAIFVRAQRSDDDRAVNHVEQMHQSRCYRASAGQGQLGCISCHDPHVAVAPQERVAHYRQRCLSCHQRRGCSVPQAERLRQSPQDSCLACHMPRYSSSDVPHTASTDHRIPRHAKGADPRPEAPPRRAGDGLPLRPFHRARLDLGDPEIARDLGIALVRPMDEEHRPQPANPAQALKLLEEATARHPEDWEAWEARATALAAVGRASEALTTLETVLAKAPRREGTLLSAALLATELRQVESALDYWRRAVEMNPAMPAYRRHLTVLLGRTQVWDEAGTHAEAWVRLAPSDVEARMLWITCLLRGGRKSEAQTEFERVRALRPPHLAQLEAWFAKETR